jgi:hypothetical protein
MTFKRASPIKETPIQEFTIALPTEQVEQSVVPSTCKRVKKTYNYYDEDCFYYLLTKHRNDIIKKILSAEESILYYIIAGSRFHKTDEKDISNPKIGWCAHNLNIGLDLYLNFFEVIDSSKRSKSRLFRSLTIDKELWLKNKDKIENFWINTIKPTNPEFETWTLAGVNPNLL